LQALLDHVVGGTRACRLIAGSVLLRRGLRDQVAGATQDRPPIGRLESVPWADLEMYGCPAVPEYTLHDLIVRLGHAKTHQVQEAQSEKK
jgi:Ni,Fe-hydrogenase III small subunit